MIPAPNAPHIFRQGNFLQKEYRLQQLAHHPIIPVSEICLPVMHKPSCFSNHVQTRQLLDPVLENVTGYKTHKKRQGQVSEPALEIERQDSSKQHGEPRGKAHQGLLQQHPPIAAFTLEKECAAEIFLQNALAVNEGLIFICIFICICINRYPHTTGLPIC